MNIFEYNRIMIIGNNGSGKSYLAEQLASITELPMVHLDLEFWGPNWEKPPKVEWIKKQRELVSGEKWIIDGNHTDTMELRFQSTDLILFLDYNRFACIAGVIKRYGRKRSDMPQYLEERWDMEFFRFCRGVWNFARTRKLTIMKLHDQYPEKPFYVIESRRRMNKLLDQWREERI